MNREREVLEVDVLFVGGGPASLSGAIHLSSLIEKHNRAVEAGQSSGPKLEEPTIAIIEKGSEIGAHSISGAVLDPKALLELMPDHADKGAPIEKVVDRDEVYHLTAKGKLRLPIIPPPLHNKGNYTISLSRFVRWLGGIAEERGVNLFPGFAGVETLYDGNRVIGVRTGDKGMDSQGSPKSNYEPGVDILAKVTLFGEGARGFLSKQVIGKLKLDEGKNPQVFETGVKDIYEMPPGSVEGGRVIHTMGYPFRSDAAGGTFIYNMSDNMVSVGLVVGLDYRDPLLIPHTEFQKFKLHPFISSVLRGARMAHYGGKAISAGGYYSIPRLVFDGGMLIGECASLVDMSRLKGIHLAMKSGMLAAEAAKESFLKGDFSSETLMSYEKELYESYIGKELYRARNFHQALSKGLYKGLFHVSAQQITGGRGLVDPMEVELDHKTYKTVEEYYGDKGAKPETVEYDGVLTRDKLTDVYHSGTIHDENQPCHLKIGDYKWCYDHCNENYQAPCVKFCPANVYEMLFDERTGEPKLQINFTNCIHCQTCDIKCPYDNIRWTPPEGGGGPKYTLA